MQHSISCKQNIPLSLTYIAICQHVDCCWRLAPCPDILRDHLQEPRLVPDIGAEYAVPLVALKSPAECQAP